MYNGPHYSLRRQRGTALAIGLILLLVITLLSMAGMRSTVIQERIASNLRDRSLAFQSADSALRAAEQAIAAGVPGAVAVAAPGDKEYWEECWTGDETGCPPATIHSIDLAAWGIAAAPEYRLEQLHAGNYGSLASDQALSSPPLYRITVRAVGGTADSVVLLQATYRLY
ncbi:pilus assembly PilX family protein [Thiohalocapsa halophila]